MKAEDKAKIMETLSTLTKSITKLQEEIKGLSSCSNPLRTAKSKAQVGLISSARAQQKTGRLLLLFFKLDSLFSCSPSVYLHTAVSV